MHGNASSVQFALALAPLEPLAHAPRVPVHLVAAASTRLAVAQQRLQMLGRPTDMARSRRHADARHHGADHSDRTQLHSSVEHRRVAVPSREQARLGGHLFSSSIRERASLLEHAAARLPLAAQRRRLPRLRPPVQPERAARRDARGRMDLFHPARSGGGTVLLLAFDRRTASRVALQGGRRLPRLRRAAAPPLSPRRRPYDACVARPRRRHRADAKRHRHRILHRQQLVAIPKPRPQRRRAGLPAQFALSLERDGRVRANIQPQAVGVERARAAHARARALRLRRGR
mmetsp:Transcript_24398/g.53240  ORF Transcript_24398/g.53240 Transcript_24398/m.53240 type:complete len:288 (+) Transcript_24398:220-1083(+)